MFPDNWYSLSFKERKEKSSGSAWLYDDELPSNLIGDDLDYIRSLPEFLRVNILGVRLLFSHFVVPDLTGSSTTFPRNIKDLSQHFVFMMQNECPISFSGHIHAESMMLAYENRKKIYEKNVILLLISILPFVVSSQNKDPKFGIEFSGFVKTDTFYDTRQTINIREGHFLLYPDNLLLDANKVDINAKPTFNMLSIQSRLKGAITGPEAFGAKTSGVIEADFFGNENASFIDANGFRLRHAFLKLNWKTTELIAGQYWHPMFIAEAFPGVISFNTGAPFQPFSRNPQVRISKNR